MKQPELGKKISELRKEKGLTQEELVDLCNVNVRTIQRIESGEVTPRSYTLKTILKALDYDLEEIKTDVENTITVSKNQFTIINLAFWIGIVFVIAFSFSMFMDLIMELSPKKQNLIGFTISESLYVTVQIVCAVCAFAFYFGFFTTGKILKNSLLKVSAILFMIVEITSYSISAFLFDANEYTSLYYTLFVLVFYGCVGIPFGIGILKTQKYLGQYASVTGIFTIILYSTMLTVILVFISLFLCFPVMILQLILLYKIKEYLQNK